MFIYLQIKKKYVSIHTFLTCIRRHLAIPLRQDSVFQLFQDNNTVYLPYQYQAH